MDAALVWIELALLLACILVGARSAASASVVAGVGLACSSSASRCRRVATDHRARHDPRRHHRARRHGGRRRARARGGDSPSGVLRGNPRGITLLAPLVMYVLIFMAGTQHVAYALLPVIAEVAEKAGIRPERPLSISVIATQHGLIASPISAVTVALLAGLAGAAVPLPTIMMITIPATLIGLAGRHRERGLARPRARRRPGVSAPARRRARGSAEDRGGRRRRRRRIPSRAPRSVAA